MSTPLNKHRSPTSDVEPAKTNGSNEQTEASGLVNSNGVNSAATHKSVNLSHQAGGITMEGAHGAATLTAPPPPTNPKKPQDGGSSAYGTGTETKEETCWEMFIRIFCYPVTLPLLFIKLFYFSFIGALGCILPFLSIYYKQQGLTPQQIGLISGLRPVTGFISGPLWGAIADRFRIRRAMLLISILSWLGVFVGLAFVPTPDRLDECPEDIHPHRKVINLNQDNDEYYTLKTKNGSENVTKAEYDILRESIGWIYEPDALNSIFITILLLILLGEFFQSPTTALSDAGAIQELGMENLEYYGSQRAWGPMGWALSSVLVGWIVATTREQETICGVDLYFSEYYNFVYVFVIFMVFSFVFATQIKFKDDKKAGKGYDEKVELKGVVENEKTHNEEKADATAVLSMFFNLHYGSWITTAFFVGVCNGIIWGFLSWHLDNLGADQLMIGVASLVTCLSEFIMFYFVGPIIRKIGHINIMYSGLFLYSVRFAIYGSLVNPWWVIPAEILQGVTFSCIWVSLTAYSAISVPAHSLATIQGILHGVYFGLGSGTGHLIGGIVIGIAGAAITFYAMSAACLVVLFFFFLAQKLSTKPDLSYQKFQNE